jgi:hypothetical protein
MDPITAAILAVLPALASDVFKSGVKDAYEGLKAVIRRRWGDAAPISKAITAIEEDPKSKAKAAVLEEKVGAVKAAEDPEVAQALRRLVEQMKTHGIGGDAVARIQVGECRSPCVACRSRTPASTTKDGFRSWYTIRPRCCRSTQWSLPSGRRSRCAWSCRFSRAIWTTCS